MKALSGRLKVRYWTSPPGLAAEQVRKPSAKRLNKRAMTVRKKSVNETARKTRENKIPKKGLSAWTFQPRFLNSHFFRDDKRGKGAKP